MSTAYQAKYFAYELTRQGGNFIPKIFKEFRNNSSPKYRSLYYEDISCFTIEFPMHPAFKMAKDVRGTAANAQGIHVDCTRSALSRQQVLIQLFETGLVEMIILGKSNSPLQRALLTGNMHVSLN